MKIRLVGDLSGTRNGKPWPPRGTVIQLNDEEAVSLCSQGMAVPVPDDKTEKATTKDDSEKRAR